MKYLLLILLASCAQQGIPKTNKSIPVEVIEYYRLYEQTYGIPIYDIPIYFTDMDSKEVIGICTMWSNGYSEIALDENFWQLATYEQRVALLFHELGHCDIGREHDNSMLNKECEYSLMTEYMASQDCLEDNWDHYINELGRVI